MGELLKLAAGGSFAVNGTPFAFCEAGVLFELLRAKAKLGAATANAAITIKGFSMVPVPLPDPVDPRHSEHFMAIVAISLSLFCEGIRGPVAIMTSD